MNEARSMVVVYEGMHTYGGLAGRDMEAMARGIEEAVQDSHMDARIGQVEYLGNKLRNWGIPIVDPIGGHAVYLDARRFLPHLTQDQYPAQMLAAQLYLEGGIRAMERGIVSAGRDPETGRATSIQNSSWYDSPCRAACILKRTLTLTAEVIADLYERRETIPGLEMTYEPRVSPVLPSTIPTTR